MPLCTIAIPVYNRATLIHAALASALAQDMDDLEILVVDNASTDGTWEALQHYDDPRLRLVRNESNVGLFGNFNRCLELAQGDYLRFLCSDDRLSPDCLREEINLMKRYPNAVMLSTQARSIDASGLELGVFANHLPPGIYPGEELIGHVLWVLSHYCYNPLNYPSGILLQREAAYKAGNFDSSLRLVGDLDLFMRILKFGDGVLAGHIGCDIMMHTGQAGEEIMEEGDYFEEWFTLASSMSDTLQRQGIQGRVWEQLAACSLWASSSFLRRRKIGIARLYWHTATTKGLSPLALVQAVIRMVWFQICLRKGNRRFQPTMNRRPLEEEIECPLPIRARESGQGVS